jgi:hypothetical protein
MIKTSFWIIALIIVLFTHNNASAQIFDDLEIPNGYGLIITHTAFSDAVYYRVDPSKAKMDLAAEPVVVEAPNWNKKKSLSDSQIKKRKRTYYGVKLVPEGKYALVYMTTGTGSHLRSSEWIWCFNQNAEVFKVEKGKITVLPPRVYRIIKNPPLDINIDEHFETVAALINRQTKVPYDIQKAESLGAIKFQAESDKECKVSESFSILTE